MNKAHGSRKQQIEMYIKLEILNGDLKRAIDLCEMHNVSPKRFGKLVKEVEAIGK